MQEGFASTFEGIFTKGIKSFEDLFASMKRLFIRAIAEMAAADAIRRLRTAMGAALLVATPTAAQSAAATVTPTGADAGLFGAISAHPILAVGVAVGALIGVFAGAGRRAKEEARQIQEARAAWDRELNNFAARLKDTSAIEQSLDELAEWLSKMTAAAYAGLPSGTPGAVASVLRVSKAEAATAVSGMSPDELRALADKLNKQYADGIRRLADEIERLDGINAKARIAFVARQAALQAELNQDARIRLLRAQGLDEQADREALTLQHVRERAAAEKELLDITALVAAQTAEWARLLQQQADAAQKAAEEEAKRVASVQQNFAIRELVARGLDDEAAALRRKLDQERELADETDAATRAIIERVHALENEAYAAAQAAAAAEKLAAAQLAAQRASEDIAIEILRLKGLTAEADEAALRQARADRIAAAGENVGLLGLIEEWFALSLAKLQPVAGPGAVPDAAGAALSRGATAASTAVQSTVTERTAYQLVDINRSQLVVLRQIDRGIRWLGGRRGLSQGVNEDMADDALLFGFNGGNVGRN